MDSELVTVLVISLLFALVFGPATARSANRRQPVHGGALAHLFHTIGAGAFVAVLPGVLTGLIVGAGFVPSFLLAVGFLLLSYVALLAFAVVERPAAARAQAEAARGWTEDDARASGL
jgi:hypothetical protein